MWPHVAFRRRILRRTVGIWLGVRLMALLIGLWLGEVLITPPWQGSLVIVVLVTALTWRSSMRRNELLILANFGVPTASVVALVVTPTVLLELLIRLAPLP